MVEAHARFAARTVTMQETLEHVIQLCRSELPFAAQVAQLALQCESIDELERGLASLYRIALEHGQAFMPDLVDGMLCRIEDARAAGVPGSASWRTLG